MEQKKTALVYPSYVSFTGKKSLEGTWIHHGISSIISYANKMEHNVDLIDLRQFSSWSDFEMLIAQYELVGYSILSQDLETALKCIKLNKNANPDVKIVVGGVHVTVNHEEFVKNDNIDFIIIGEGEIAFSNLINSLSSSKVLNKIIKGHKIELEKIPFIKRELWSNEMPSEFIGLEEPFFTLIASRACIYNCSFCQPCTKKMFGKKERIRSPENLVDEIVYLKENHDLKSFFILDDNAFQNRRWIKNFLEFYEKTNINAQFVMSGRSDNIYKNRDLLPKLSDLGLKYVLVGFESGSQKVLKYLRKGTTVEINEKAAKELHENGIGVYANIMFGFPIETKEDIKLTENMVKKIKPDLFSPTTFTPYPGNYLTDEYVEKGLLFPKLGNLTRYPDRPKIRGVDYLYINWTILKIQLFLSKNYAEMFKKIIYYSYLHLKIIKFYLINYLGSD
ncbi:MAG: radical SAM protein [Methanobacteriaceae archaeon]|nr:radical SAM protein [Methanobacteriaceae archaeon]